ncbi:MAG: undecaprenyl-diphosphate phosphatase [Candidatus Asgardarchaeia archaeon]
MDEFLAILLLGMVQGILEWFPVSSEGFIVSLALILGVSMEKVISLAIFLHIGTAAVVFLKYRSFFFSELFREPYAMKFIFFSTVGTALTGIPIFFIANVFTVYTGILITLFIGIFMVFTGFMIEKSGRRYGNRCYKDGKIIEYVIAGIVQGFSIIPGLSRSGITTSFFLLRGYEKEEAFNLSFIMSVPAVLGAFIIDYVSNHLILSTSYFLSLPLVVVLGYLTISAFLGIAKRISFGPLCIFFGLLMISLSLVLIL